MTTFQEFRLTMDHHLGLQSSVVGGIGEHILQYRSPSGILLFTLLCRQEHEKWVMYPVGDALPELVRRELPLADHEWTPDIKGRHL